MNSETPYVPVAPDSDRNPGGDDRERAFLLGASSDLWDAAHPNGDDWSVPHYVRHVRAYQHTLDLTYGLATESIVNGYTLAHDAPDGSRGAHSHLDGDA